MAFFETLGAIGGALSGASSFMGSLNQIFGSNDYQRLADQAYYRQRQMMNDNNKFQAEENQKARDYTREMYEQQWNDFTDFNSYVSMVKRAEAAGISPAALFQSGAPTSVGGISPASVGHSASPSPSYGDIVNPVNRQAEAFHSVSSGLQALSLAQKTGLETTQVRSLMSAQVKNLLSEAGFHDIRSKSEDFELGLRQIYGKKLYDSELGRNAADMVNKFNQAYLFAEEGKSQESVRLLNNAERLYKDILRDSTDKQIEMLNLQLSWYPKEMVAKIKNLNSSTAENYASSREHISSAEQMDLFNKIYSDKRYQHSIISQAVTAGQQAIDQNKLTRQQVQHMNYMIEQAAYANDLKEFTYWSNQIQGYVHSIGEAASAFYGAGALRELIKMRQLSRVPVTTVQGFK